MFVPEGAADAFGSYPKRDTPGNVELRQNPPVDMRRADRSGIGSQCDTHGNVVQSPLVVLFLKVRKGGGFFYGKSSNENHTQGV